MTHRATRSVALALAATLLGLAPLSALGAPLLSDDAGSGRDAPNSPKPEVPLEPGVVYQGNLTISGGDTSDWYVFGAEAGQQIRARLSSAYACLAIAGSTKAILDTACATGVAADAYVNATLPATGTWYFQVRGPAPSTYYLEYRELVAPHKPLRIAELSEGDPLLGTDTCPGAPPAEMDATHGAGDPALPSLAWAALKTGFRAAIAWTSPEPTFGTLTLLRRDGSLAIEREPTPRTQHVFVLDGLPQGELLCFKAGEGGAVGTVESGWHMLRLANGPTAYDDASGVYTVNLLVLANENVIERHLLETAVATTAHRLYNAGDGYLRLGTVLILHGDLDRAQIGLITCSLSGEYALSPEGPGCAHLADVVFTLDNYPTAAGVALVDGIQLPRGVIYLNTVHETPERSHVFGFEYQVQEISAVLLHELGHYAFGALDLYANTGTSDCYDPATGTSIMSTARNATEFDDEATRCPNEADLPGYIPSWTLIRARYPRLPERPTGPAPGPVGDGGAFRSRVYAPTPSIATVYPGDDAGSGRDAPSTPGPTAVPVIPGRVYKGNLTSYDSFDTYVLQAPAGATLRVRVSAIEQCLALRSTSPEVIKIWCDRGQLGSVAQSIVLPHEGPWYLRTDSRAMGDYWFSFALDAHPPDPAQPSGPKHAVAHDDARTGRDAPDSPFPDIPVAPRQSYRGAIAAPGLDEADWFALEGAHGNRIHVRVVTDVPACAFIRNEHRQEFTSECTSMPSEEIDLRTVLTGPGPWFLVFVDGTKYRFAYALNGQAPRP